MIVNSTIDFSKYYKNLCFFVDPLLRYHRDFGVFTTSLSLKQHGFLTISQVVRRFLARVFTC
jgi:hypothetical protein